MTLVRKLTITLTPLQLGGLGQGPEGAGPRDARRALEGNQEAGQEGH